MKPMLPVRIFSSLGNPPAGPPAPAVVGEEVVAASPDRVDFKSMTGRGATDAQAPVAGSAGPSLEISAVHVALASAVPLLTGALMLGGIALPETLIAMGGSKMGVAGDEPFPISMGQRQDMERLACEVPGEPETAAEVRGLYRSCVRNVLKEAAAFAEAAGRLRERGSATGDESIEETAGKRTIRSGSIERTLHLADGDGAAAGDFDVIRQEGRRGDRFVRVHDLTIRRESRQVISGFAGNVRTETVEAFEVPEMVIQEPVVRVELHYTRTTTTVSEVIGRKARREREVFLFSDGTTRESVRDDPPG